jgi:hypothetical protein
VELSDTLTENGLACCIVGKFSPLQRSGPLLCNLFGHIWYIGDSAVRFGVVHVRYGIAVVVPRGFRLVGCDPVAYRNNGSVLETYARAQFPETELTELFSPHYSGPCHLTWQTVL